MSPPLAHAFLALSDDDLVRRPALAPARVRRRRRPVVLALGAPVGFLARASVRPSGRRTELEVSLSPDDERPTRAVAAPRRGPAAVGAASAATADVGLRRGRRARARTHGAAPARRRPALRDAARLGRAPARRARGQGAAPRPGERRRRRCANSRREAELLERLAHPVVVRGFDAVPGGRFPHLAARAPRRPDARRLIAREGPLGARAGAAARAARRRRRCTTSPREGVVHLDVKPEQPRDGRPAAADRPQRGAAVDEAARSRAPIGTDAYMAPEQCGAGGERAGRPAGRRVRARRHAPARDRPARAPFPRAPRARRVRSRGALPAARARPRAAAPPHPAALAELLRAGLASSPPPARPRPTSPHGLEPLVAALPRPARARGRRPGPPVSPRAIYGDPASAGAPPRFAYSG